MKTLILLLLVSATVAETTRAQQYGVFTSDNQKWKETSVKFVADGLLKGALGQTTSDKTTPLSGSLGLQLTNNTVRFTGLYKVGSTIDTIYGHTPKDYLTALLVPEGVGNSSVKLDLQLLNVFGTSSLQMNVPNFGAIHAMLYVTNTQFSSVDRTRSEEGTIVRALLAWNPYLLLFDKSETDGNRIYLDAELGVGYYGIGGDFAQPSNAEFRTGLLGGDEYRFISLHMGVSARVNSLKLAFEFPYLQALNGPSRELYGMTGLRFVASASVDANFELVSL